MKKIKNIFIIFGLFFGLTPYVSNAGTEIEIYKTNYAADSQKMMSKGSCHPIITGSDPDHDHFLFVDYSSGSGKPAYWAGGTKDQCSQGSTVCIIGPGYVPDKGSGENHCWTSAEEREWLVGINDYWQKGPNIKTCSEPEYNAKDMSAPKVFLTREGKILSDKNGTPFSVIIDMRLSDITCIASVCKIKGKYFTACPDGTCKENCPGEKNDPENPDNPGDNPTVKHRNSVQSYLDALNNCLIQ